MKMFYAKAIFVGELPEFEIQAIIMAEHADGSGERLELQRAAHFDDQDVTLGQNTYCISTDQGSVYGGIVAWRVMPNELTLTLAPKAHAVLGFDRIVVRFDQDLGRRESIEAGMRRIVGERE